MNEDLELLRRYADEGAQEAFAELVRRKVDLVYSAALRQTGGDSHLAQDVTQSVFLALACRGPALKRHPMLTGWLYTTTRFLATKAVRTQARWQRREREANTMSMHLNEPEPAWIELRPVIDEAMHELDERDRVVLLLRYFESRSLSEVGSAIGLAENAARMRVERALQKLRVRLARRGVTSTAAALGGTLAAQPMIAAQAGLAASAIATGLAGAAVGGAGALAGIGSAFVFMNAAKLAAVAAVLVAAGAFGGYLVSQQRAELSRTLATQAVTSGVAPEPANVGQRPRLTMAAPATITIGSTPPSALDSLRVLMDLHRRKLVTPAVHVVTATPAGVQLTAEFADLFGLTAGERAALQRGIDEVRERIVELGRENTRVARAPNGDVTLEVKPFPEAGGEAYDAMMKSFATTLGTERYNAFLALEAEQMEKELGRFGTAHAAITFSRETSVDGEARYRIRSRFDDTPDDKATYVSDRLTFDEFMREAGPWAKLLPPDFAPPR